MLEMSTPDQYDRDVAFINERLIRLDNMMALWRGFEETRLKSEEAAA